MTSALMKLDPSTIKIVGAKAVSKRLLQGSTSGIQIDWTVEDPEPIGIASEGYNSSAATERLQ